MHQNIATPENAERLWRSIHLYNENQIHLQLLSWYFLSSFLVKDSAFEEKNHDWETFDFEPSIRELIG